MVAVARAMTRTPLVSGEDGRLYVLYPSGRQDVPPVRRLFEVVQREAVILRLPPPRLERADIQAITELFRKLLAYQSAGTRSGAAKE